jgi:lysine/ornithine N-monooxygenase/biotin carboxylase
MGKPATPSQDTDCYDVLGVGFGPANIALAVGFEELWPEASLHFLDRSAAPSWQAGMLLPGTDIQHYALRDLVTPRNPRSKYSFLNFLHAHGRLFQHTNLGIPFPLRSEYAQYVGWVAEHFLDKVSLGTEVVKLAAVPGAQRSWIEAVTSDGRTYRARAVVLGPGRTPYIPGPFAGLTDPGIVHSTDYEQLRRQLGSTSRVAVIGGSQSAVEIVLDLHRLHVGQVIAVTRGYGYRQKDTSPFDEEVFHPEFTDYFYARSPGGRADLTRELRHTNYAAADADVIRELYRTLYEDWICGRGAVVREHGRTVISVQRVGTALRLSLRERHTGEESQYDVDAIVLATGFRNLGPGPEQERCPPLLEPMASQFVTSEAQGLSVTRDYQVVVTDRAGPVVFLNGLCESSHGFGDAGSFGQVALRAQRIVESLRDQMNGGSGQPALSPAAVDPRPKGCLAMIESNLTGTGMQALRYAHESGWRTLFLTADLQPYTADAGAAQTIAECTDEVIDCVTIDPDDVERKLKEHPGPLVAVMTVGEYYIPVAAEVASRFGLPGLNPRTARLARNKLECRQVCAASGVSVPAFGFAATREEAARILTRTGLPCVVKPIDESASVGVSLCRTVEQVFARLAELAATDRNSRGQPHPPGALIEQYLPGPEVSVESVTLAGRHTVLGVTDKSVGPLPWFVETGHTFPSALPTAITGPAVSTALAALDAIGFDFGAAHTEVKITETGTVLIEVNPRTAGDHIPSLIWHALGVPLLDQYVSMHTGATLNVLPQQSGAAAIRFITGDDGQIKAIDGIAEARESPGVVDFALRVGPGDATRRPTNSHQRLGHVIAAGETPALAATRAQSALGQLSITY